MAVPVFQLPMLVLALAVLLLLLVLLQLLLVVVMLMMIVMPIVLTPSSLVTVRRPAGYIRIGQLVQEIQHRPLSSKDILSEEARVQSREAQGLFGGVVFADD